MLGFIFKSVMRRLRRYSILVIMIAFGIATVTLIQSVTEGMKANVIEGSARYIGGRYVVVAKKGGADAPNIIEDQVRLVSALKAAGLEPSIVSAREVVYTESEPTLIYNGTFFKVRKVCGVDPEKEASILSQLVFLEGGFDDLPASNRILVSKQVADRLGTRVGDEILLQLFNKDGYLNSARLLVGGVFRDASLFGYYNCYMDYDMLRQLVGDSPGTYRAMGFSFSGNASVAAVREGIVSAFEAQGLEPMRISTRRELDAAAGQTWDGTRYAVIPVEDYIDAKVMDLIYAIQIVSYIALVLILVIILVGMRNTTHILTRRRTKEIGTMRALGMSKSSALTLIISESLVVATLGFAIGLVSAVVILSVLGSLSFAWMEGFDIFLKRGHLSWSFSTAFMLTNYCALVAMTVLGSLPAAKRATSIPPATAIASIE